MADAPPEGGKARRTYDALVLATRDTIAETGVFSIEEAAGRAKVSQATFYSYFSSKDMALAASLNSVLADLNEAAAVPLRVERLLETDLRTVLRELVLAVVHSFRRYVLVFRVAIARLPECKPMRDMFRERQDDAVAMFHRWITLGQAAGRVRHDDVDRLSTALLITLQGYNNPILLRLADDDPVIEDLVDMLERLLAP